MSDVRGRLKQPLIKSFCGCFTGHVSRFLEKSPPMLHGAEGKSNFTAAGNHLTFFPDIGIVILY
jgi:hypothetical protein